MGGASHHPEFVARMSLINEALKKAQRQRAVEEADVTPPVPGGGKIAKRRPPRSVNATLILATGALVLVVLSVVVTVMLVNRPDHPAPPVAAVPSTAPAAGSDSPPAPEVTVPLIASTPKEEAPPLSHATTTPEASSPVVATTVPAPASASEIPSIADKPAIESTAPPPPPAKPDPRVYGYIDALRVTGIRATGEGSRVLMNERVYRVNDIVEHSMGIRLIKVEPSALTFSDVNGATYMKYF